MELLAMEELSIFAFLLISSGSYALAMWYVASRRMKKDPQEPGVLWLERWIGRGKNGYLLFSLALPMMVILLNYVLEGISSAQVQRVDLLVYGLFYFGSSLGLWLWRKAYCILLEVLPKMITKTSNCPERICFLGGRLTLTRAGLPGNLKGFVVAAGSDPVFSIINIITALAIYALFAYTLSTRGIYYGPLALFVTLLTGGMVGPMATISMFFVAFCSLIFRGPQFYDLCAPDRCGGFKKLGNLISQSKFHGIYCGYRCTSFLASQGSQDNI